MKNIFTYLTFYSIFFAPYVTTAQTYFSKNYPSAIGPSSAGSAVQLPGGNYVVGVCLWNQTKDMIAQMEFLKVNPSGDTILSRLYTQDSTGMMDVALKQMNTDEFIFFGETYSVNRTEYQLFNMAVDSNGNELWYKSYANPPGYSYVGLGNMFIGKNKEIIDVGNAADNVHSTIDLGMVLKADSNGNLIWEKMYGATPTGFGGGISTKSGYIIVGGNGDSDTFQNFYAYAIGIDTAGNLLWQKKYGNYNESDYIVAVIPDTNNTYTLCGGRGTMFFQNVWLAGIDSAGNLSWQKKLGDDSANSVYMGCANLLNNGNIVMAGGEDMHSSDSSFNTRISYAVIMEVTQNGDSLWKRVYAYPDSSKGNLALDIQQTSDSGFIACGFTMPSRDQAAWLLKVDQLGNYSPDQSVGTGIGKLNKSTVSVFPNPANTLLHVTWNATEPEQPDFLITDMLGQIVKLSDKFEGANNEYGLDIHALPAGIYFLTLKNSRSSFTEKFVKD